MTRVFVYRIFLLIAFILGAAQGVHAEDVPVISVEPGYGTTDDVFNLEVIIGGKNSGQLGQPSFSESEDFDIQSVGTSTRNEFVNGVMSYHISFAFQVTAKRDLKAGTYQLPSGKIMIDGEEVLLNPGKVTILPSGVGKKQKEQAGVDFTQVVDNESPYVGEQIVYRAEIATSLRLVRANLGEVPFDGFLHESFGKGQERRRAVGNTIVYAVVDGLFPTKAGELEIASRPLELDLQVPRPSVRRTHRPWSNMLDDLLGDLDAMGGLGEFEIVKRRLTASAIKINVKELPPAPRPNLGYVPVGEVKVSAVFDRTQVKLGESVSLTVIVSGDANLKPLQLPEPVSGDTKDFTSYPDQPKVEVKELQGRLYFKKTFQVALIPQRSGALKLPAYEFVTFDPSSKEYKLHQTPGGILNVLPGAGKETLVAKGLPDGEISGANKEEIEVLGEDLHPIHLDAASFVTAGRTPPALLRFLLIAPPLITALIALWAERRRRASADPARTRQSRALRNAQAALDRLGASARPEEYLGVLRSYLGDRLRLPGESLTSADSGERLGRAGLPPELTARITELLGELQRAVYGGPAATGSDALGRFSAELRALLSEVERHAK